MWFVLSILVGCAPEPEPVVVEDVVIDDDPPVVWVAGSSLKGRQGAALAIWVRTEEDASISVTFLDRERAVFPMGEGTWRALVGIPIRADPGEAPLTIAARDAEGNRVEHQVPVAIEAVDWPQTGKLPMSRRKARVEPEAVKQMRSERDAVYRSEKGTALWSGPMRIPVDEGVHTSAFGSFREYPDGSRNHHDAEDIARKRGVPIYAANDGIVALAHPQEVHGNAVLIDHGHGVVSLYSHLHTFAVSAGDRVAKGDLLGTMGSTGRTTGPHLHWGIVVDEVAIDPMPWTISAFEDPGGTWFRLESE